MKYYQLNKNLASPFIFTCEHASRVIPQQYANLGLTLKNLKNAKDLFDPGALDLTRALAKDFNANIIYVKFSRLLIDANRILGAKSNKNNTYHSAALKTELLIEDENGERPISIPSNQMKNQEKEEKYRWHKYVKPYYKAIEKLSLKLLDKFDQVYIFQIHSFYPKYNGEVRKVDIGMIHNKSRLVKKQISLMRIKTKLDIGDNEPWGMKAVGGGILKPLQKQKGLHIIGIDINHKHLTSKEKTRKIEQILSKAVKASIQ